MPKYFEVNHYVLTIMPFSTVIYTSSSSIFLICEMTQVRKDALDALYRLFFSRHNLVEHKLDIVYN